MQTSLLNNFFLLLIRGNQMKKLTKLLSLIALLCLSCACALFTACEVHHHTKGEYLYTLPATCTAFGYDYYTCSTCSNGRYSEIIPKAGHDFTNYFSDENATCEQNGTETAVCNREECSAINTREIANSALGHSFGEYVYNNNATCTQNGTKTAACQREGCKIIRNEVVEGSILEHELSDWIIVEESTCTSNGSRCKKCLTCEVVFETETIPLLSHYYEDTVIPSTCITQGYTYHECKICGYSCTDTYLELLEHTKITIDAVAPTCTLTGLTEGEMCLTCDEILVNQEIIPSFGHTEVVDLAIPADCENSGLTEGKHCLFCNKVLVMQEVISANGHNYEDSNQCCVCEYISIDCFEIALLSDATYEIKAKDKNNLPNNILIPSSCSGKAVTSIGDSAFYSCSNLITVEIPDSVTSIGYYAFYDCNKLTEVNYFGTIDDWVEIEFNDFHANPLLYAKQLKINGKAISEVNLTSATKVSSAAFGNCESLTSVTMGDSVTSIADHAFSGCSNLTSVVIGNSVTTIGKQSFSDCRYLTSVVIGSSVKSIGYEAFSFCRRLVEVINKSNHITITNESYYNGSVGTSALSISNRDNSYMSRISNDNEYIIYTDGDEKILIGYTGNELNLIIPAYVTRIYKYAFDLSNCNSVVIGGNVSYIDADTFLNCDSLTSVVIGDSVTSIRSNAFSSCDNLTSVIIGNSVTSIGDHAFYGCRSLPSIKLSENLNYIGEYAFQYCTSLTYIEIPENVKTIDYHAFEYCYNLVEVANKSTHITIKKGYGDNGCTGYYALAVYNANDEYQTKLSNDNGYIIYSDGEEKILVAYTGIESDLIIPSCITKIKVNAFRECDWLTSVVISDSVTSIGSSAFRECSSLTSVTIGDSVTSIGYGSFAYCRSLNSVVIGGAVISIDEYAFLDCSSLASVYYKGTKAEWSAIKIVYNDNLKTGAKRYYYSAEKPLDEGDYWYYDENGNVVEW